jgi:hypothetical protein
MAYYLIIVEDRHGWHQGVRELDETDPDKAWMKFEFRAKNHYGSTLLYFECYRLARRSPQVLEHIAKQGKQESSWQDVYDISPNELDPLPPKDYNGKSKYIKQEPFTGPDRQDMAARRREVNRQIREAEAEKKSRKE